MIRALAAALLAVLCAGAASANADGNMLEKLGMVGRWAEHCDRPAGPDNAFLIYRVPDDGPPTEQLIMSDVDDGDRLDPLSNIIVPVEGRVQWTQVSDGTTLVIVTLLESTRLKTWSSVDDKGVVYVREGAFAQSEGVAPWFNRCETN